MEVKGFANRRVRREIKAFKALVRLSSDLYLADEMIDANGWLEYCTHEPFSVVRPHLRRVRDAFVGVVGAEGHEWELRVFCPSGLVACFPDGREIDECGQPIDGTDVFADEALPKK